MPREESLIPYQSSELTGARILVLAAHPDDESFGAGGTLALSAGRAEAIRIWIATDGTGQEGVAPEGVREYAARRREEAVAAAAALGLEEPRFAGLADRSLAGSIRRACSRRRSATSSPTSARTSSCARRPRRSIPTTGRSREVLFEAGRLVPPGGSRTTTASGLLRIGFYELSHPILPNALVDIAAVAEKKDEALAAYASQQSVRDYAGAIQRAERVPPADALRAGPVEAFRVLTYAEASTTLARGAPPRDRARPHHRRRAAGPRRSPSSSARATGRRSCARRSRACGRRRRGRSRSSSSTTEARRRARSPTRFRDAFDGPPRGAAAAARPVRGGEPRRRAGERGAGRVSGRRRPLLPGPLRTAGRGSPPGPGARRLLGRRHRGLRPGRDGLGAARPHAPVLARLRSGLPAARQLHPDPHAAAAARALHQGRRLRRGARVLRRLGLPDPRSPPRRRSATCARDLRVPRLRGAVQRPDARRGGRRRRSRTRAARSSSATPRAAPTRASPACSTGCARRSRSGTTATAISQGELRLPAGEPPRACSEQRWAARRGSGRAREAPAHGRERARSTRGSPRSSPRTRSTTISLTERARRDRAPEQPADQIYGLEDLEAAPVPRPAARAR